MLEIPTATFPSHIPNIYHTDATIRSVSSKFKTTSSLKSSLSSHRMNVSSKTLRTPITPYQEKYAPTSATTYHTTSRKICTYFRYHLSHHIKKNIHLLLLPPITPYQEKYAPTSTTTYHTISRKIYTYFHYHLSHHIKKNIHLVPLPSLLTYRIKKMLVISLLQRFLFHHIKLVESYFIFSFHFTFHNQG